VRAAIAESCAWRLVDRGGGVKHKPAVLELHYGEPAPVSAFREDDEVVLRFGTHDGCTSATIAGFFARRRTPDDPDTGRGGQELESSLQRATTMRRRWMIAGLMTKRADPAPIPSNPDAVPTRATPLRSLSAPTFH